MTTELVRRGSVEDCECVGSGDACEEVLCTGTPNAGVTTEPKRRVGTGMFGSDRRFFGAGSSFGANQAFGSALRCDW